MTNVIELGSREIQVDERNQLKWYEVQLSK